MIHYTPEAGSKLKKELFANRRDLFEALTDIVNRIDPIRITIAGRYEYDAEVADLMFHLDQCGSEDDVRELMLAIFSYWFTPDLAICLKDGGYDEEMLALKSQYLQ